MSLGTPFERMPTGRLLRGSLALGLLVRLALAPLGWHGYDLYAYGEWAWQLLEEPRSAFYAAPLEVPGDHLPGDLTIMWALAHLTHRVAPGLDFYAVPYKVILKLVPILCDLALALGMLRIGRRFTTERRAVAIAAFTALNPAAIVISAVWGQWDAVSMAMVVWAIALLLERRVAWALPLLAYACLLKPQLGLFIPLFAIADVRMRWTPSGRSSLPAPGLDAHRHIVRLLRDWGVGGAASVALILATCLPFGVGLPGMPTRWSLVERIEFAANRFDGTSHGAFNVWYLRFPRIRWDGEPAAAGITYAHVGLAMAGIAVAMALWGAWRLRPWPVALAWGGTAGMLALFLFPTRVHERYLFPAVVLAMLLWIVAPGLGWVATGLSVTSFVNVYLAYAADRPGRDVSLLLPASVGQAVAMANLALFGTLVWWGVRAVGGEGRVGVWREPVRVMAGAGGATGSGEAR